MSWSQAAARACAAAGADVMNKQETEKKNYRRHDSSRTRSNQYEYLNVKNMHFVYARFRHTAVVLLQ